MSSPLDLSLRRSCDRCHEQKVRCIRDLTLSEEGTTSCVRCRKAGAICLYSPQLRAGRPPACKRSRPSTTVPDSDLPAPSTHPDEEPFSPSLFFSGLDSELAFEEDPIPLLAPVQALPREHVTEDPTTTPTPTTTTSSIDPVDNELMELGELARRIHRSAHVFTAPNLSGIHPLSVSSPAIQELCDAAFALIRRIPNLPSCLATSRTPFWAPTAGLPPLWDDGQCSWSAWSHHFNDIPFWRSPSSLDAGLVLMVLACHQRLMAAFENVTLSVSHHLLGPTPINSITHTHSSPLLPHHIPPHPRHSPDSFTTETYRGRIIPPPQSTQALLIVELLDHLLDQLDGAFRPLLPDEQAGKSIPEPSSTTNRSTLPSPRCSVLQKDPLMADAEVSLCVETARSMIDAMQHRHGRLRGQLKEIRRRIKDTKYH
ncbi:hypothetical protein BO94DRAFT_599442 [Aspergillus sclerotioniger CBS 115572]|uniref:Zn(2)-C6 fungal-type domain-containing protein n=1 Tax=Aspergillus sclerotioniger CBS 115572 TaxID=1450535 RepID=A0A317WI73_9EURO|nr:hypothetical protein BO94DRAFT_599442 [Aspergillus sclerotioniger CBS 115572]PWY83910.1 hypothetical protein BO94DRAFT_599442 [Aspergillus sclerotioniger CBS 115572]